MNRTEYQIAYIAGLTAYSWVDRGVRYVGKDKDQTLETAIKLFLNRQKGKSI